MEEDRIVAALESIKTAYEQSKTLVGLRNIAWAAANKDKSSSYAKFIYTTLQLMIESPASVGIVQKALLHSSRDIHKIV